MFLPIKINSINKISDLEDDVFTATSLHYRSLDRSFNVMLFEYSGVKIKRKLVCDVIVYLKNGDVLMSDYMLLKDGNWRNSFGEVSADLISLLPKEFENTVLVDCVELAEFSLGASNV
jgi:hypothetical protein